MSVYYRRRMIACFSKIIWGPLNILIILYLKIIFSVDGLVPINTNDQSICKQYHKVNATRQETYIETYQNFVDYYDQDIKTRKNYRIQNFFKWEMIETCCPGYEPHQHDEDAEKCISICPSGCVNGRCHLPNVCKCNPTYRMSINDSTGYSECLPICSSGCYGGSCMEPEICTCDDGYTLAKDQGSCQASCINVGRGGRQGCGDNASCIAPDTCKCDDGYAESLGIVLELGLNMSNVVCKPLCEPDCGNIASCVAPNECQCNTGYVSASSSEEPIDCRPVCEQNCINSFCKSPNKCSCNEGYIPHLELGSIFCEPFCQDDCINAKCTLPNHCECAVGYEKLVIGNENNQTVVKNVCSPVCHGNCQHGRCIAPGQCHCNLGYVIDRLLVNQTITDIKNTSDTFDNPINLLHHDYCTPFCEDGCPKGSLCIAPNQCQTQQDNDKNYNEFLRYRTRVIHYSNDCGDGDSLMKEVPHCLYDFNGTTCTEPSVCAIILADSPHKDENLMSLQSIVFVTNGTEESGCNVTKSGNNETLDLCNPRCTDECRILISFREFSPNVLKHVVICYELESYNVTASYLLSTKALPTSRERNQNLLCLMKSFSTFDSKESKMISNAAENKGGSVVSGIVGTVIALIFIAVLGLSIYLVRKKFRRIRRFNAASASNVTMMERSEMCPFNTRES